MQINIHLKNPGILIPEFEMFTYKPGFMKNIVFKWLFFKIHIEYKVSKL